MKEEKTTTKKPAAKRTTTSTRTAATKKVTFTVNAENAGFRAGDVYQTLAAAKKPLTVTEIAKEANISKEEAYLGIGWLFKEGKIKETNKLIELA